MFSHHAQPIQLRHRTLRDRVNFGAHTANMSEGGLPHHDLLTIKPGPRATTSPNDTHMSGAAERSGVAPLTGRSGHAERGVPGT